MTLGVKGEKRAAFKTVTAIWLNGSPKTNWQLLVDEAAAKDFRTWANQNRFEPFDCKESTLPPYPCRCLRVTKRLAFTSAHNPLP